MDKEKDIVRDLKINGKTTLNELLNQMKKMGGFTSKKLAVASDILDEMTEKCDLRILSFPSCIVSTGTRGIIKELVKQKKVDAIITTVGTPDHDLARTWKDYYAGDFEEDDVKLRKKGVNREGNVLVPNEAYWHLEDNMKIILEECYKEKKIWAPHEIIWKCGEFLDKKNFPKKEESIIYWCWKNKIPMFIPGALDGAWGYQIWLFWQYKHEDLNLSLFLDDQKLSDLIYNSKKSSALMIGGGISKHHTIWWQQFRNGLDYAIYITTAVEWDGSLSGARLREAISWGKVKPSAKQITVEGDATVLLPLLASKILN
ncbi:MAG: deoxyhypusine synthase [Candidatus Pacearchaeota archaeon]|jgi:deoxyhypusine synthase